MHNKSQKCLVSAVSKHALVYQAATVTVHQNISHLHKLLVNTTDPMKYPNVRDIKKKSRYSRERRTLKAENDRDEGGRLSAARQRTALTLKSFVTSSTYILFFQLKNRAHTRTGFTYLAWQIKIALSTHTHTQFDLKLKSHAKSNTVKEAHLFSFFT